MLAFAGGLTAVLSGSSSEPVYETKATLLVREGDPVFVPAGANFTPGGSSPAMYSRLITSKTFLKRVAEKAEIRLDATELQSIIKTRVGGDPPTVEIIVRYVDPTLAATVADSVAREFIDHVTTRRLGEIARLQNAATAQGIINVQGLVAARVGAIQSLSLLEPVLVPASPVNPGTVQNLLLGLSLGIAVAAVASLMLDSPLESVRTVEQINRLLGVSCLGTVFRWSDNDAHSNELIAWKSPRSWYAESYRQIRANLQFASTNLRGNVLLVCSPGPGEGKTTIACNLAASLANSGSSVVIIDADMRRPSVHKRFEALPRSHGLSNYLADPTTDPLQVVHTTEIDGVSVVPSGPTPPNPSELLGSSRMKGLLDELGALFDIVVVDSPPLLLVADGSVLASQAHGAIVVVSGHVTRLSSLRASLMALKNTRVTVLGVLINKLKRPRFGYGYTHSDYYHPLAYEYNIGNGSGLGGTNPNIPLKASLRWLRSIYSRIQGFNV